MLGFICHPVLHFKPKKPPSQVIFNNSTEVFYDFMLVWRFKVRATPIYDL